VIVAVHYSERAEDRMNLGQRGGMNVEPEALCIICRSWSRLKWQTDHFACLDHRPKEEQ
jgi:hypothetical protein